MTRRRLPTELAARADEALSALGEASGRLPAAARERFRRALACSRFFERALEADPAIVEWLAGSGASPPEDLRGTLRAGLAAGEDESETAFMTRLRRARRREFARIAWRDLNGLDALPATLAALSDVADACIEAAVAYAEAGLAARHGVPRSADGTRQPLVVLAMGKLGGRELNFSSDVDLVFLYPEAGQTDGERPLENEAYFIRLGQRVIRLLDQVTQDGFVFRVDMRLRPFGASGPLAVSFPAFETYLQRHGRDWERYAYVKARAVTGVDAARALDRDVLRPFVYRRYIDYGVFRSLREMKAMIEQDVARRELDRNVKLGAGGIREIEFVTQSLQLVRGGRDASLRTPSLLEALPRLADARCLGRRAVDDLFRAYEHLRRLENRIQMLNEQQTHELPEDEIDRQRLAVAMDAPSWEALASVLEAERARVREVFRETVFGADHDGDDPAVLERLRVWRDMSDDAAETLAALGIAEAGAVAETLSALRHGTLYERMDEPSRHRLDQVMPAFLERLTDVENPAETCRRVTRIFEAVGRRSAYLALLNENPAALGRLLEVCSRSDFLTAQLATYPMLLDELLDDRAFQGAPDRESLAGDLAVRLAAAPEGDLEARLDAMRQFQRAALFRVAVADIGGVIPLMKVSDRLTDVAELTLELALDMARGELEKRHGRPRCGPDAREVGFAIVGYGKLGGLELGYGSDLDIVFVHDSTGDHAHTDGERPLENPVYFSRLASRIIHFLSIQTTSGKLYEVDTRLRPSGRSGLLVSSLAAFERYQREEAWTWEHQALLRSRAVAGDRSTREAYEALRARALCEYVDRESLRDKVASMRRRMREELSAAADGEFDVKQDRGGLADLEFLVQYLVLAHAADEPALVTYSDNIRQLESLARAARLRPETAERLAEIYRRYRQRLHALSLADRPGRVAAAEFAEERAFVAAEWDRWLGG